jgi:hypothetical protein
MNISVSVVLSAVAVAVAGGQAPSQKRAVCLEAGATAIPARLLPIDEAAKQPEFFTFRARLQVAVAAKDVDAVVAAADRNIKLGFGGADGIDRLRAQLIAPDAAGVWKAIARVLALGGSFKGSSAFEAPYVFANWPHGIDSFECQAVVGASVLVRQRASPEAPSVARVSYAIVQNLGGKDLPDDWSAVRLAGGQKGFMRSEFLAGPTGLRAIFNLRQGQWRLMALVAGD